MNRPAVRRLALTVTPSQLAVHLLRGWWRRVELDLATPAGEIASSRAKGLAACPATAGAAIGALWCGTGRWGSSRLANADQPGRPSTEEAW